MTPGPCRCSLSADQLPYNTRRIAQHLGVRMASVTGMIKHLAAENYLKHKPYYGVKLTDKGRRVAHFASRARSAFYDSPADNRTLGTLEAFESAALVAPPIAKIWLDAIMGVTKEEIEAMVREVPPNRMSEVTRRFTVELITVNQERLVQL